MDLQSSGIDPEGNQIFSIFKDNLNIMYSRAEDNDSYEFENLIYLGEIAIKLFTTLYCSLLKTLDEDKANLIIKPVVIDADGLGAWLDACSSAVREIRRTSDQDLMDITEVWTKKASSIYDLNSAEVKRFTAALSPDPFDPSKKYRGILDLIVFIRNKKAHGAYTEGFYVKYTPLLKKIVTNLTQSVLMYVIQQKVCLSYIGLNEGELKIKKTMPNFEYSRELNSLVSEEGTYIEIGDSRFLRTYDTIRYNINTEEFYFLNSKIDGAGRAEFLSYASGNKEKVLIKRFNVSLRTQKSHTSASPVLIEGEVVWHNLPQPPSEYVKRSTLEAAQRVKQKGA